VAFRFVGSAWKSELDEGFPASDRFYIDFRQQSYPPLSGSPTFTLIAAGDNQPGSHNLTGGHAKCFLDLTDEVTVSVRLLPTGAYNSGNRDEILSWYVDATHFLTLYYDGTNNYYAVQWQDGGTARTLESSTYANDGAYQVWTDVCFAVDLANGTGALYVDRSAEDTSWSGAADTRSTNFPTLEIRAENTNAGPFTINHVRVFPNLEATAAQVSANFSSVLDEEVYFPLNGVAVGRTRCNVTSFVTSYDYSGEAEKEETAAIAANSVSMELLSKNGEFADDQYAAFDAPNSIYNGTSAQRFMTKRCPVIVENWYGNDYEPVFVGRLDTSGFQRTSKPNDVSKVKIKAEDFAAELGEHSQRYTKYFEDKKLSDSTEADSLVHLIGKLASEHTVYNYASNSSFENATIANSWTVSGTGATFTRQAGGLLGSYQGDLAYGSAPCDVTQAITFDGYDDKLNVGETYTFSIYLSSASACGDNISIEEHDASGVNDSTTASWSLSGGDGWQRFDVSHTITDSDSDELRIVVDLDDNVTLSMDCAMLILGSKALNWFVLNDNDGSSGTEAAEDADSDSYDQVGFDADAVNITHGYALVAEEDSAWDHLQQIADATVAYYLGMDQAGTLRYRSPFATGYSDPTPAITISAPMSAVTEISDEQANRIIVRGVEIVKDTGVREVWNAALTGDFNSLGSNFIYDNVLDGGVWPGDQPYWAKYANIVVRTKKTRKWWQWRPRKRTVRTIVRNADETIIGASSLSLLHKETLGLIGLARVPVTFTETTFDTTTRNDAAHIVLTNDTGSAARVLQASIRGKLVRRLAGDSGRLHDKFRDDESIRDDGETAYELDNDYIVTEAQLNQLADYLWKDNRVKKHMYRITLPGERHYINPGEWVTLDFGGAGEAENIDSKCRVVNVRIQRGADDIGKTSILLREVEENWTFSSNSIARYLASGGTYGTLGGRTVTVASSTYSGPADIYCDGTADDSEIQDAVNYCADLSGGTVQLTEGTFNITSTLTVYSNVVLQGQGDNTEISHTGNSDILQFGSSATGARVRDMKIENADTDNYTKQVINWNGASRCIVAGCIFSFAACSGVLIDGDENKLIDCYAEGGKGTSDVDETDSGTAFASSGEQALAKLEDGKAIIAYMNGSGYICVRVVTTDANGDATFGSEQASTETAAVTSRGVSIAALTSTLAVVTWYENTDFDAMVVSLDSSDVATFGAVNTYDSNTGDEPRAVRLSDTKLAIAYWDYTSTRSETIVGTVSGTTISFGSSVAVAASGVRPVIAALTDSLYLISYDVGVSPATRYVVAVSVSGTTPTVGSAVILDSNGSNTGRGDIQRLGTDRFATIWVNATTGTRCVLGSVSGTTITLESTESSVDSGTVAGGLQLSRIDDQHFFAMFHSSGDGYYAFGFMAGNTISWYDAVLFDADYGAYGRDSAYLDGGLIFGIYVEETYANCQYIVLRISVASDSVEVSGDLNIIANNHIVGLASYTQEVGIRVSGDNNKVVSNQIDGDDGSGNNNILIGISVDVGANRTNVSSNNVLNCDGVGIADGGDDTLFDGSNLLYANNGETSVESL